MRIHLGDDDLNPDTGVTPTITEQGNAISIIDPVTGQVIGQSSLPQVQTAPSSLTLTPPVASSPSPVAVAPAAGAGVSVAPVMLPSGVAVNPQALNPASGSAQLTAAQLLAATGSSPMVVSAAPVASAPTVPFNFQTWLTQSTVITGVTNQTLLLGGGFFALLAVVLISKKKKR
jgi:hypothetical protein